MHSIDEKDRQIRSTNKYVGLNITDMITHDEDELTEFLEPLYETEDVRSILDKKVQEVRITRYCKIFVKCLIIF